MADEDRMTDPADSQEDRAVPKDASEQASGTVGQPVRLGAQEQALAHPNSRDYTKYTIIGVIVAVVAALALIAAGIGFGIHARNERVARERAVAAAQAECDRSIDRLTAARGVLAKDVRADGTQAALRLTDGQVQDAKTVDSLKRESKDSFRAASCRVADVSVLKRAVRANDGAARAARAQDKRLRAAVGAVEGSKAAKDEADRKAEEARKAGEAAAAAQAAAQQAQSASSAPVKRQSSSSNSSAGSDSSTVRRQSSAPRRSYTAPRRSYQAPRRTYTAPRRTYTAPRRSYTPARRTYAPRRSYTPAPRRTYTPRRSNPAPSRPAPRNNGGAEPDWVKNALKMGHVDKNAERVLG